MKVNRLAVLTGGVDLDLCPGILGIETPPAEAASKDTVGNQVGSADFKLAGSTPVSASISPQFGSGNAAETCST